MERICESIATCIRGFVHFHCAISRNVVVLGFPFLGVWVTYSTSRKSKQHLQPAARSFTACCI